MKTKTKTKENITDRLSRIFPNLVLHDEGDLFSYDDNLSKSGKLSSIDLMHNDLGFMPPHNLNWYEFINILNDNGLDITERK